MGSVKDWLLSQADEEAAVCPYGHTWQTCPKCHSDNPDVYWNSCDNAETRDALDHALAKDD